jgi:muramoyltetrapeptide carboxypeptidase
VSRILLPPRLRRGATVGIAAPGSPAAPVARETGIAWLRERGFSVRLGAALDERMGYLAGGDDERANDLNTLFADPGVDAVFCLRGGYGCGRLLPLLDFDIIRRHPKILLGYSDVTALALALWTRAGLVTFAGPMVAVDMHGGMDPRTEGALWTMLGRPARTRLLDVPHPAVIAPGRAEGTLLGGNLAVLMTLLGTPWEPDWTRCVLLLEDVGENVYRIDRMLAHLLNAGVLRAAAGVLLGRFTGVPEDNPNRELDEVLREYLAPLGVPVLAGLPFGHVLPKITFPIGARVRVDAMRRTIRILHPVVA